MTIRTVDAAVSIWDAPFEEGRKLRSYLSRVIPVAGPAVSARYVAAVDFTLDVQQIFLTQGALQLQVFIGATTGGAWTPLTPIGLNRSTFAPQPLYNAQNALQYGGSFTGGTKVELLQVRAASQNASATTVKGGTTQRRLPPGTYHMLFQTLPGGLSPNDAAQMIYNLEWTEHP